MWKPTSELGIGGKSIPGATLDALVSDAWQRQTARNALFLAITKARPYFGNTSWRAGGGSLNSPWDGSICESSRSNVVPASLVAQGFLGNTTEVKNRRLVL